MRQEQINIYKFNELPKDVQEKVISEWRRGGGYYAPYENQASLGAFAKQFNITIEDYDYGYRNFINFTMPDNFYNWYEHSSATCQLSGVRLWKYLHNNDVVPLLDGNCPFTGYYMDEVLIEPIREFIKHPDSRTFEELLQACLDSWIKACDDEYQYWLSEECIKEDIEINEHEFTIDGRIH